MDTTEDRYNRDLQDVRHIIARYWNTPELLKKYFPKQAPSFRLDTEPFHIWAYISSAYDLTEQQNKILRELLGLK